MRSTRRHRFAAAALAVLAALALAALLPAVARAEEADSPADALKKGTASLAFRLRYETVSDDASPLDAHAPTLRTVLGYGSAAYRGFSVFAEAENVAVVGQDLYNNRGAGSAGNGVRDRPVVADPAITEINQALVRFDDDDWQIGLGRQEIVLADARFVGNVGWRQNHQSYDALRVDHASIEKLGLTYVYFDRVNRIFGDARDLSSHALWAKYEIGAAMKVTGYGFLLDFADSAAGLSTKTFGLELAGKKSFDGRALLYEIELARQSDAAENPRSIDAGYSFLMVGAALPKVTIKLGWEVLEGSAADGQFSTPLATLHKFNGWADKFLATPVDGLEDLYLAVDGKAGKAGGIGWSVRYHDFSAETGGGSYGRELDLQLLYTAPSEITFGLKGALYDADRFSVDTKKWMLWAAYKI